MIFNFLNANFRGRWSVKNAVTVTHAEIQKQSLFVELYIDQICVIGCASVDLDFSNDVSEKLLEAAVACAYKNYTA